MYIKFAIVDQYLTICGKRYNIGPLLLWKVDGIIYALLKRDISDDLKWPLEVISATYEFCQY